MDQGARPTFDELYRQCGARVYGYCRRLCDGNETEAQDLAQETFVRAYRGLDQFEGRASVLTWLFQIARHERIRAREKAREAMSLDAPGVRERGHDPRPEQERRLWLNTALQRLPEQLRDALILVKCEGLTYREAAEVLGIPQGTVQFHVHQAMKQMRVLLTEQFGLPLAVALLLSLYLQRPAPAETVPPGLTERVYDAIGRPVPPAEAPSAPPDLRRVARLPSQSAALVGSGALVLAVSVPVLIHRSRNSAPPKPPTPRGRLEATLASLSEVQSTHARAAVTRFQYSRREGESRERGELEFWYKRPSRYLRAQRRAGKLLNRLVIVGKRAVSRIERPQGEMVLPHNLDPPTQSLGVFAVFAPDGEWLRRLSGAQVTSVAANGEYGETERLSVEVVTQFTRRRWLFYLGAESKRPIRLEYFFDQLDHKLWRHGEHLVIESVDYNLQVADSLFDLPAGE